MPEDSCGGRMPNFDLAKTLDTAVKAPLWIWFALMIASLIPMFNFPNLVETGVDSSFRLGPVPLSLAALGFTALFCSSATARSWSWLRPRFGAACERWSFWMKLRFLPAQTRALLYVLEDDGKDWDFMEPDHPAVDPAKDAGLLVAQLTAQDRTWAHIRYTTYYDRKLRRYREHVRPALRVEKRLRDEIRQSLVRAGRAARRLGGR